MFHFDFIKDESKANLEAMEKANDDNIYKKTFKLYKNWNPKSNLPLIDLSENESCLEDNIFEIIESNSTVPSIIECETIEHFKPFDQWRVYKFTNGLMVIPGILKEEFRSKWFQYFHETLPQFQEELNLKANIPLNRGTLFDKLRWITFGYHYDWDTKVYHFGQTNVKIPDRIRDLCNLASIFLGLSFKPEAGIVNYYLKNSSLCFHTDYSEINHQAPLFSLSLGSPAIFLIGGQRKDSQVPIMPILLRDSDLIVMSGESRLALHSIPKITTENNSKIRKLQYNSKKKILRINVNIRQVF